MMTVTDGAGRTQTVDIGQITTIWQSKIGEKIQATASRGSISEKLIMNASQVHEIMLERLYKAKVGQEDRTRTTTRTD